MRLSRAVLTAVAVLGLTTGVAQAGDSQGNSGSDWTKPFTPDEHTVVLYHFDEGKGNDAYDACGDGALTLRAHKKAQWGSRTGFGTTARFERVADDADLRVGPTNNNKLHLKTCTEAWTVEAWIRCEQEHGGKTSASICSTDDEGFGLRKLLRSNWRNPDFQHATVLARDRRPARVSRGPLLRKP